MNANAAKPHTSIIHMIWTTSKVPDRWLRSSSTWPRMNHNFVYCLWNHSELEAFVADEYPWLLSTYLAYPYVIQRCDAARYLLLYHYGGTYADLDLFCLSPLSVIFADAPIDAGMIVAPTIAFRVGMFFIVVRRPRDPVMRGVISGLRRNAASYWYPPLSYFAVVYRVGTVYFTRRLNCYRGEGGIYVIPWSKLSSYIDHLHASSWHKWDSWIIWKIYLLLRWLYHHPVHLALSVTVFLLLISFIRNPRLSWSIPRFSG